MDNPFENSDETSGSSIPPLHEDQTQTGAGLFEDNKSNIVTARGTADGLVLRLDGRVELASLRDAMTEFLDTRRSFVCGNDVLLEWVGTRPDEAYIQEISRLLSSSYDITVRSSKLRPQVIKSEEPAAKAAPQGSAYETWGATQSVHESYGAPDRSRGLFGGIEGVEDRTGGAAAAFFWDEPDARIVYATLRSGQKIETEHSVVVFGDVNSGAEIIAGGDIVILGILRGIAHAGAYDETGGGRVIFALNLQPTQLRIGTVISRGVSMDRAEPQRTSEVARVEGNMIVVEPYQSRAVWGRRRR